MARTVYGPRRSWCISGKVVVPPSAPSRRRHHKGDFMDITLPFSPLATAISPTLSLGWLDIWWPSSELPSGGDGVSCFRLVRGAL